MLWNALFSTAQKASVSSTYSSNNYLISQLNKIRKKSQYKWIIMHAHESKAQRKRSCSECMSKTQIQRHHCLTPRSSPLRLFSERSMHCSDLRKPLFWCSVSPSLRTALTVMPLRDRLTLDMTEETFAITGRIHSRPASLHQIALVY